jgi:hypothetical protein
VRKTTLVVALGSLLAVAAAQVASATHPHQASNGAKKITVPFVPAFRPCNAPNSYHGPPLMGPSCTPPRQASPNLTIGRRASSSFVIEVFCTNGQALPCPAPGDQEDLKLTGILTDVRCKAGTSPCPGANTSGGSDYGGEVQSDATIRITDAYNGSPGFTTHGTVRDLPLPVPFTCALTSDPGIGGTCAVNTAMSVFYPDVDPVREGKQMVIEIGQIHLDDGGSDGDVHTPGPTARPNSPFAVQGIYIP